MSAARIRRLTLSNFRSYRAASVAVDAQLAVLVGPNGAGKTNLIEAISFLAPGRGLRRATLDEVAFAEGDGSWAAAVELEGALGLTTLGTGIEPPSSEDATLARKCRTDARTVPSAAAFADPLSVVWMTPGMDGLFGGPASERRRFLDRVVLAVDETHWSRVNALERSLRSRNRLLEQPSPDAHWLDAIEHETAEVAIAVAAARAENVPRRRAARARGRHTPSPCPPAGPRPRPAISLGGRCARRLGRECATRATGDRSGGSLSHGAARQPRARCRRRPHHRRAASHRSRRALRAERNRRRTSFDRRAEGAADLARVGACEACCRDDLLRAAAAAC